MQSVDWLNALKLRISYGTSGNDRIGDFAFLENFQGGVRADYNGASGLRQLVAANPNLKWEHSTTYNIGLEATLFNKRLAVAVDFYNKKTTGLILNNPIPRTNGGIASQLDNIGEVRNSGFDIDISSLNYKTPDFIWATTLNLGWSSNTVLSLPGANEDMQGRRFVAGSTSQRAIEGYSVNTFYLIRYAGVNPDTGDAEWLDMDGKPTSSPTTDDRVIVGDAHPDLVGGLHNRLVYKSWDLSFFFNFSIGNDIYVSGLRFVDNPSGTFNKRSALLDVWGSPGDNAFAPAYTSTTFSSIFSLRSTAQLKSGSYARLKNLSFSYSLPQQILDHVKFIKGARIYFTAHNLLTIKGSGLDGIDPEVTSSSANGFQGETFFAPPQFKTYLFGLRVTF